MATWGLAEITPDVLAGCTQQGTLRNMGMSEGLGGGKAGTGSEEEVALSWVSRWTKPMASITYRPTKEGSFVEERGPVRKLHSHPSSTLVASTFCGTAVRLGRKDPTRWGLMLIAVWQMQLIQSAAGT